MSTNELETMLQDHGEGDPNIEMHFSKEELAKMSDYEKRRLRNIKRNYTVMNAMGIAVTKPDFMKTKKKRFQAPVVSSSDSDSDVEWTPLLEKQRAAKTDRDVVHQKCGGQVNRAAVTVENAQVQKRSAFIKAEPEFTPLPSTPDSGRKKSTFKGFGKNYARVMRNRIDVAIQEKESLMGRIEKNDVKKEDLEIADPIDIHEENIIDEDCGSKELQSSQTRPARYPQRKCDRFNYAEIEMPDEDEFVYCEECDMEYLGHCPFHFVHFIEDPLDIDVSLYGTEHYAEKTMNHAVTLKKSGIQGAGFGIWSTKFIQRNTIFGPYDGLVTKLESKARESGYAWLIYRKDRPHHYVDARDKGHSNWMRWVNCASFEEQQNLLAFQYKGDIYYRTIKDINEGTELLVWYGDDYAKELGLIAYGPLSSLFLRNGYDFEAMCKALSNKKSRCTSFPLADSLKGEHKIEPADKLTEFASQPMRDGVWACEHCGRCFTSVEHQAVHRNRSHGITIPIDIFNVIQAKKDQRQKLRRFENKKCAIEFDERSFDVKNNVQRRKEIVKYEKPFQCQFCDKCFSREDHCKTHERIHTGEKPYRCQFCDKCFSREGNCKTHERIHTGEKPYRCQFCDKCFSLEGNCKTHERIHTGEKPYRCQFCDKCFSLEGNCKTHERIHTGEKPYRCQFCDKCFSRESHCKTHERIHTGEKPYRCQFCDKCFSLEGNCKTHERIHTGEKPYRCQFCDKCFSREGDCKTHERIHTGEKPYRCQFCDKCFSDASAFKKHERTHK